MIYQQLPPLLQRSPVSMAVGKQLRDADGRASRHIIRKASLSRPRTHHPSPITFPCCHLEMGLIYIEPSFLRKQSTPAAPFVPRTACAYNSSNAAAQITKRSPPGCPSLPSVSTLKSATAHDFKNVPIKSEHPSIQWTFAYIHPGKLPGCSLQRSMATAPQYMQTET